MPYTPYKEKTVGQYVPFTARQITPLRRERPSFQEPEQPNIALETIKGLPGATVKVAKGIGSFLKGVQEEIARSGASVALTAIASGVEKIGPKITGITPGEAKIEADKVSTIVPSDTISKLIFGDRSLESIENRIAQGELNVQDFAKGLQEGRIDIPTIKRERQVELGKFLIGEGEIDLPI